MGWYRWGKGGEERAGRCGVRNNEAAGRTAVWGAGRKAQCVPAGVERGGKAGE